MTIALALLVSCHTVGARWQGWVQSSQGLLIPKCLPQPQPGHRHQRLGLLISLVLHSTYSYPTLSWLPLHGAVSPQHSSLRPQVSSPRELLCPMLTL